MLLLKAYNSKVEISCQDEALLKKAKKLLNIYWVDKRDNQLNSVYLGRGNFFPIGFLPQFLEKLKKKSLLFELTDLRSKVHISRQNLKFNSQLTPMPHQEKALEQVKLNDMGILSSPTASGKAFMIGLTIADKFTTSLVIVPTTQIRDQIAENLKEWFGSKAISIDVPVKPFLPEVKEEIEEESEVDQDLEENPFSFMLKKKKEKKKETPYEKMKRLRIESIKRKLKKGDWYKPITVLCWQSLKDLPPDYIKALGLIVIDECHTASVKAIRDVLFKAENAPYRYGFSATPWRDQPHNFKLMQSALGSNVIFDYSPEEAIDDEVIAKPNLNIIEAAFPKVFLKNTKNYRRLVDEGIIRNEARNEQIVKKAIELYDDHNQVFIAIDEVSHFEGKMNEIVDKNGQVSFERDKDVSYSLKAIFERYNQPVIFISGNDSTKEKNEKIKALRNETGGFILVGTMAVGIGTDIPGINKVINASTGESSIRFLQRIGRGMRNHHEKNKVLEVFDFMDRWNQKTKAFSIKRINHFRKHFKGCKVFGF